LRINIQYKIIFIFAVIVAIILSGTYLYLNNNLTKKTYLRIKENLLKETFLSRSILEKYSGKDYKVKELDGIADDIGGRLEVRATIIGIDGKVLGDSDLNAEELRDVENHFYRPEVQKALKGKFGESRRFSTTVKKDMLYIATTFGEGPDGVVRLSIPLSEIDIISNNLKKMLMISFLFAFILVIFAGSIASALISKPLKEVSTAAAGIAGGDFSGKIYVSTKDEIGDLADAFNHMSEQIKSRIEEVVSNKTRLEAVLLSMFDGVMVVNTKGEIILMNPRLKDVLKVTERPEGKKPLNVLRNIEVQEITDAVLDKSKGIETREVSLFLPEEKIFSIHATAIIRDEEIDGGVLVFHDITQLRRLEEVRRDFVANVSHELRTPVSNIKGYAETLLEGALKDKKNAEDFLNIIHSDSDRLAKLISDLLDLSKIESGKIDMDIKPCKIRPIAERVVAGLQKQAVKKSVTVEVNISESIPNIAADEAGMAQVLLNLIDNALKFTDKAGKVTISAEEKKDLVQIDVADTGCGIPEDDLPRIFERFYRVDKAHSRELGGTGLGLSIVKHIVQSHGGEVFVHSILGKGSTFSFTIPKA
jgi:two-component system phosphate regulon sensor histidine kinase PhoR